LILFVSDAQQHVTVTWRVFDLARPDPDMLPDGKRRNRISDLLVMLDKAYGSDRSRGHDNSPRARTAAVSYLPIGELLATYLASLYPSSGNRLNTLAASGERRPWERHIHGMLRMLAFG
jgi:hypothetical protein